MEPGNQDPPPKRRLLDMGLRAAFGGGRAPNREPSSVLARLSARLESPEGDAAARTPSRRRSGRYHVVQEIARGGIGVVRRCLDADLGRAVAMKVLRDERMGDPVALNRFIEEAQIGGQLQHPGIVPIYDLGLQDDERPYFTMKLVEGQTLAELLAERVDVGASYQRCLSIFHQVCQTVAYAHSRGVIHRDLKPANVMVGAFGEVQVVDWGLAKLLARDADSTKSTSTKPVAAPAVRTVRGKTGTGDETECGVVMGTPAYMPPEQAQGDVERLDERSDVFALGAILCEILSGKPPYDGDKEVALRAATTAALETAFERLRSCEANQDLVELCRRCLAPARADRPRDARVVEKEIGDHLARAAERARAAELNAAEALGRAGQERRARKLTAALATTILAAIVAAGGVVWYTTNARHARIERAERRVNAGLGELERLLGLAQGTTSESSWNQVLAKIQQAEGILDSGVAAADVTKSVAETARGVIGSARALVEQQDRNRKLLARLDDIETTVEAPKWPSDIAALDRALALLFSSESGVDLDRLTTEEAVSELQSLGSTTGLAVAIDHWAMLRVSLHDRAGASRLVRIANAIDDDDARKSLRLAILDENREALVEFASALARYDELDRGNERLPAPTLLLLAKGLRGLKNHGDSLKILSIAQRRFPSVFGIEFELGELLASPEIRKPEEALQYLTAAQALRTESVAVRYRIGVVLYSQLDRPDDAVAVFKDALKIRPDCWALHLQVAEALHRTERTAETREAYDWVIQRFPATEDEHICRYIALVDSGNADAVRSACLAALAAYPDSPRLHLNYAQCLARANEREEAIAEERKVLALDPHQFEAREGLFNDLLYRMNKADEAEVVMREGIRRDPSKAEFHHDLAVALRTRREFSEAVAEHALSLQLRPDRSDFHRALGDTLSEQGDVKAARKAYAEALEADENEVIAGIQLGELLGRDGEHEEAIAQSQDAVRRAIRSKAHARHGSVSDAELSLGAAYEAAGDLAAAAATYREVTRVSRDWATGYGRLASVLRKKGDLRGAIDALRRAVDLAPNDGEWQRALSEALQAAGEQR